MSLRKVHMESKTCFIIMPFSSAGKLVKSDLDYIYSEIFKKALEEFEIEGVKYFSSIVRYESKVGSIIEGIIKNLNEADLVIADLTSLNPNVMYELGVRHSLKRGTIILSQDLNKLPSDLRDYLTVEYKYSTTTKTQKSHFDKFKIELHKSIRELIQTDKYDSPVLSYFKEKKRFRNEDQIDILKANAIKIDVMEYEFEHLQHIINAVYNDKNNTNNSETAYQIFSIKLNNFSIALNDLDIQFNSGIFYEQIINSKTLIEEVIKTFSLGHYYSVFPSQDLINLKSPKTIRECIEKPIVNIFDTLNDKELTDTNIRELFKEGGILDIQLMDYLAEYVEKKTKELGLDPEEIEKVLTS